VPDTFTKNRPTAADAYPAEAAGLAWLASAGPDAARVVDVVAVSSEQLVLRRLAPSAATRRAAADFGAALAATHAAGAPAYGAPRVDRRRLHRHPTLVPACHRVLGHLLRRPAAGPVRRVRQRHRQPESAG